MTHNILDVSRIRAGQTLLVEPVEFGIHLMLESVLEELSTIYGDRFVLRCPAGPVVGSWDYNGFQRIIENLYSKAIKYGDPAKKVTLTLEKLGGQIKISIHNWGQPISKEDQGALFRPYHRNKSAQDISNRI